MLISKVKEELKHITGFGDYKISRYGANFLKVIQQYAKEHNLPSRIQFKAPKREKREKTTKTSSKPATSSTQNATLSMYRDGLSITEIAAQRKLSTITIEGHLAAFIGTGDLDISRFVSNSKLEQILSVIKSTGQTAAIKPIKDLLSDEFSYGEIRMAMEHFKRVNG